jgi:dsRNA-specific ribonuclease
MPVGCGKKQMKSRFFEKTLQLIFEQNLLFKGSFNSASGAACRRVTTSDALLVNALTSLFGGIWLETGEQATSPTPISLNKQQRHWRHGVKRLTNLQTAQFVFHNVFGRDC